jgi:hypothetical protein
VKRRGASLAAGLALWLATLLAGCGERASLAPAPAPAAAGYAGSARCAACHAAEARAWAQTAHGLHGSFAIEKPEPTALAVGSRWMQAYLLETPSGLHRINERCWDLTAKDWRGVPEVLAEIAGSGRDDLERPGPATLMPLTGRTFETDCAGCHASGAFLDVGGLDVQSGLGRLRAQRQEEAISCEACHGPGLSHAQAWAKADASRPMVRLEKLTPRESLALCARCHGGPPTVGDFGPADAPHYVAQIGMAGAHFPDGRAAGQVYQVDAFVRSGCHLEGGLVCADCHDPHGPGRHGGASGDWACTRCHEGFAARSHTHHAPDQPGARCVECHMPRVLTGLLAHQRDHRIGVPLPQVRSSPDACTACHKDRDKDWASEAWSRWWGAPPQATIDAVAALARARRGERDDAALARALEHPDAYFRAVAVRTLERAEAVLDDPLPEVRLVAASVAGSGPGGQAALERLTRDPSLRVRAAAWQRAAAFGRRVPVQALGDLVAAARHELGNADVRLLVAELERTGGSRRSAAEWTEAAWLAKPLNPALATQAAGAWIELGDHARAARILAAAAAAQPADEQRARLEELLERCLASDPRRGGRAP